MYALDNFDPASSRANVLSRGLTGDLQNERVVASPIYKNHFVAAARAAAWKTRRSVVTVVRRRAWRKACVSDRSRPIA